MKLSTPNQIGGVVSEERHQLKSELVPSKHPIRSGGVASEKKKVNAKVRLYEVVCNQCLIRSVGVASEKCIMDVKVNSSPVSAQSEGVASELSSMEM